MQVLMQPPSGPAVQTAEPRGLEWKPGSRTLGGHEGSVNRVAICWPSEDDSLEGIGAYDNEGTAAVWFKCGIKESQEPRGMSVAYRGTLILFIIFSEMPSQVVSSYKLNPLSFHISPLASTLKQLSGNHFSILSGSIKYIYFYQSTHSLYNKITSLALT